MSRNIINEKLSFVGDVPSTVACTSGASTQSRDVTEIVENAPSLQKEQSVSSGKLDLKIWVKYGDSQPTRILFEGEIVDDLKEAAKKKLSPDLDDVALNRITIRRHGEEDDLRADLIVDESIVTTYDTPLQIIVNAPVTLKRKHEESEDLSEIVKSAVREEFSRQKPDEMIQASNLSETKARKIIERYGLKHFEVNFQPIEPIQCQPFLWDMENDEAHQMSEVEEWFKNALNLPRGFHVKDIHTRNYQRHLQTANVILTGGTDISVGPSETSCVWIEIKKRKENFKIGQVIGELLILDNTYAPRPMSVLTDCNDNWIIFFFLGTENKEHYLASSTIHDRSIALAIIRQFVLNEGRTYLEVLGKSITYHTNLSEPLKKRAKFLQYMPEENDERMADIIDDMTEKELYHMTMRKRLKLAKSIVRIEEQPIIDQLIRQFSDDYENPTTLMHV
ncbi:2037_t:CDS:2 [Dentiscutata heterogama]|uniref:2037_t:CDS:1 n=1 Tax=Dentiscutata heterogama TaxID=1316150 RepID=A0ACA9KJF7_9GLOM|nr:2037_t:CDS:2 [Dentiscutata heterogama]